MRVLVTGHKGYIGTVMTPLLLEAGHEVVGLDSDLYRRCTYPAGGRIADVAMIEKDTRDIELEDVEGFDAVIFLAALSNDPLGNLNPGMTYEINHAAPMRAATLAKKAGVKRFLFASSCSNYGSGSGDAMLDETAPLAPVTPYGAAKVKAEIEMAALEAPMEAVSNEAFNVGQSAHNYRIRELAEIVASVVPGCRIEIAAGAGPDTRNYRVSCEKIRRVLPAFQPQWDARKGAEQLYAAYSSSALELGEFEGPRYQRIAHIEKLLAEGILGSGLRGRVAAEASAVA